MQRYNAKTSRELLNMQNENDPSLIIYNNYIENLCYSINKLIETGKTNTTMVAQMPDDQMLSQEQILNMNRLTQLYDGLKMTIICNKVDNIYKNFYNTYLTILDDNIRSQLRILC